MSNSFYLVVFENESGDKPLPVATTNEQITPINYEYYEELLKDKVGDDYDGEDVYGEFSTIYIDAALPKILGEYE